MYRNFVDTVLYLSNYNKEKTIVYHVAFINLLPVICIKTRYNVKQIHSCTPFFVIIY